MLLHLKPEQVEIGMFVDAFDGRWIDHPFWRSRFMVETADQLARIRESGVDAVVIDQDRSRVAPGDADHSFVDRQHVITGMAPSHTLAGRQSPHKSGPPQRDRAVKPTSYAQERRRAERVIDKSRRAVIDLFETARLGRAVDGRKIAPLAQAISDSIARHSRSLLNLVRLKQKDEYTYLHSVAVCALMINFARHLQLDEAEVHELGVAGLLHDVGKVAIADDVLFKPGKLTLRERSAVEGHPLAGHALLAQSTDVPPAALEVCLRHHEKMDGTGYPGGLSGDDLSLHARMGAICDVYDAVTSDRPYKAAWTPCEALTAMKSWDGHFDPHLLEKFADSLGIYPVGTLVRLSTGVLGIVTGSAGDGGENVMVRVFFDCAMLAECAPFDEAIAPAASHPRIVGRASHSFWRFDDWPAIVHRVLAAAPLVSKP